MMWMASVATAEKLEPASSRMENKAPMSNVLTVARAVAAERERCAKIAGDRAYADWERYKNETDWRLPYSFNRVVRASRDIAAAIRKKE